MKNYNIDEIRELTIEEARQMALETMEIKDHKCIFVDFGDYFGYSVLVFKNGKHIHYADDFELHHSYIVKKSGKEALKQWYIKSLNNKLFTDAELLEDVETELKQAHLTVNIYSDILTGTMDAFASIISNNVNTIMKRMTSISIILMVPTLIASFYGMNVVNYIEDAPHGLIAIVLLSITLSALAFFMFRKIKWF